MHPVCVWCSLRMIECQYWKTDYSRQELYACICTTNTHNITHYNCIIPERNTDYSMQELYACIYRHSDARVLLQLPVRVLLQLSGLNGLSALGDFHLGWKRESFFWHYNCINYYTRSYHRSTLLFSSLSSKFASGKSLIMWNRKARQVSPRIREIPPDALPVLIWDLITALSTLFGASTIITRDSINVALNDFVWFSEWGNCDMTLVLRWMGKWRPESLCHSSNDTSSVPGVNSFVISSFFASPDTQLLVVVEDNTFTRNAKL